MLLRMIGLFLVFSSPLSAKTLTVGGARPATLLTPTQVSAAKKIPLIVFLHGFTSNAVQNDQFLGISKQRDALDFAILLPDGTKNSNGARFWNATPECCDNDKSGVDDAGYLAGLIREAQTVAPIDSARVYLIGHSNGGFMSYRMACDYPELIRGIISIAGAFFKNPQLCKNPGTLNVLQISGTADTTVPPGGSSGLPSALTGLDYWVKRGGCDSEVKTTGALDLVAASGKETDTTVWNNCQDQTRVGFWSINGAGHVPFFNSSWLGQALKFVE